MKEEASLSLEKTYKLVRQEIPRKQIDSFDVIRQVENYRQFWKPEKINVILLAESHVYTDEMDFEREFCKSIIQKILPNYPTHFVRFVYCLGYGEDELLTGTRTLRRNAGTPQFWKIFSSCVSNNVDDLGFNRVLKKDTPSTIHRLQNKVNVLRQMKEMGMWLLDASIVGLYGNKLRSDQTMCRRIIEICWENYVGKVVENAQPKFIIVIGKGVERALGSRLKFPYEAIDLPQARLSSDRQYENYRRYNEICSAVVKGEIVQIRQMAIQRKPAVTLNVVNQKLVRSRARMGALVENGMASLGYEKLGRKEWVKAGRVVRVVASSEFGERMRVTWKEKWKDDHAIIYDYSEAKGPICIVPIPVLFSTDFVEEKRGTKAYENSGRWWTQTFPLKHELSQLVLSFQNRWDIL
jgi:hypothetical protein